MKIEKINENQIRCILNSSDLRERHLSLIELAYGSDKARGLFREMIERAGDEVGFHAEDIPLMIEAIPLSSEGVMLIITKIDDPEELDTRFARFAPNSYDKALEAEDSQEVFPSVSAENILETLNRLLESQGKEEESGEPIRISSVFRFTQINPILAAARVLAETYHGANTLYKSASDGQYYLVLHKSDHTPEEFNKVCNILTEYGQQVRSNPATEAYYEEHFELLTGPQALQKLAV